MLNKIQKKQLTKRVEISIRNRKIKKMFSKSATLQTNFYTRD